MSGADVTGCRYRVDVGYEGKCDDCAEWWPLTDEFWYPVQGMRRCRACMNVSQRRGARRMRASFDEVAAIRLASRRKYNREWMRARRRRVA